MVIAFCCECVISSPFHDTNARNTSGMTRLSKVESNVLSVSAPAAHAMAILPYSTPFGSRSKAAEKGSYGFSYQRAKAFDAHINSQDEQI
jgi:hypothetical protein